VDILVTGATGAVGRPLARALDRDGHHVVAATRRPDGYDGPGRPLAFDLDGGGAAVPLAPLDPDGAAADCEAAYYLVHALGDPDFAKVDRRRAQRFADWWGPDRTVVYLGGLGADDTPSAHLQSRHEVGQILRERCRTVELRASLVIGARSLSFELLAKLGALAGRSVLPVPLPIDAETCTQPIAEADLVRLLVAALDLEPGVHDIGGPDVVTYRDLIERSARAQGEDLDTAAVIPLDPELLGPATALAAGTDPWATSALFAGMGTDAVVRKEHALPDDLAAGTSLDDAIEVALAQRQAG
jgi:uncharacterized protein YbjT (DUF2867 family)